MKAVRLLIVRRLLSAEIGYKMNWLWPNKLAFVDRQRQDCLDAVWDVGGAVLNLQRLQKPYDGLMTW